MKYYENAEDLNVRERARQHWDRTDTDGRYAGIATAGGIQEDREFAGNGDSTKLFVNLGTKDGFYKASFFQFILDMSELRKEVLGRIDMKEMNSWIEMDKDRRAKDDPRHRWKKL